MTHETITKPFPPTFASLHAGRTCTSIVVANGHNYLFNRRHHCRWFVWLLKEITTITRHLRPTCCCPQFERSLLRSTRVILTPHVDLGLEVLVWEYLKLLKTTAVLSPGHLLHGASYDFSRELVHQSSPQSCKLHQGGPIGPSLQ